MANIKCPDCEKELTSVYYSRSVEFQQVAGEKWIEKNVFSKGFSCPNCHELLGDEVVDELGLAKYVMVGG